MRISFQILLPLLAFRIYTEAVIFKFNNFVCENQAESLLNIEECRLRAISREKNTLNLNITLLQSINYCRIEGQIFQKGESLGYKPWLYTATIDACRFVKRPYHPVAIIVYRLFKTFSNLNHTCPYTGSVIVKGFYLNWNILPHAIPTGDYLLSMSWILTNTSKFVVKAYFAFREDS